jgi:hypothetical protein
MGRLEDYEIGLGRDTLAYIMPTNQFTTNLTKAAQIVSVKRDSLKTTAPYEKDARKTRGYGR